MTRANKKRKAAAGRTRKVELGVTSPETRREDRERDRFQDVLDEILTAHRPTREDYAWADRILRGLDPRE